MHYTHKSATIRIQGMKGMPLLYYAVICCYMSCWPRILHQHHLISWLTTHVCNAENFAQQVSQTMIEAVSVMPFVENVTSGAPCATVLFWQPLPFAWPPAGLPLVKQQRGLRNLGALQQ